MRVLLRPTKGPSYEVDCAAVIVSADGTLSVVADDGSTRIVARRDWAPDVADRWYDLAGRRLRRPLVHGDPDEEVLLHFEDHEYCDGKRGAWMLFGYKHVDCLNLARQGDYSVAPVFCTTSRLGNGVPGWVKRTTDEGIPEILLAPANFSRELLVLAFASSRRERRSALAG